MILLCERCRGLGTDDNPALPCPRCFGTGTIDDGSCPCGATLATTGDQPCPYCHGYTAAQRAAQAQAESVQ